MTYTDIDILRVGQLSDEDLFGQLVDNLEFLAQPPIQYYEHSLTGGNYSTTAEQFMVPIDSTNMKFTIETHGGILIGLLALPFTSEGGGPVFVLSVDGDLQDRDGNFSEIVPVQNIRSHVVGNALVAHMFLTRNNIPPGEHTVEPVWAAGPAGGAAETVTAYDDFGIFFGVWER